MSNEYIESEKIWCGPKLELKCRTHGLGEVILSKLKETDPQRVLEIENESGASLTAGEIRLQAITVAQNLLRLGVKKYDVVIVYSKSNIKITPITFALYTIGAPVNFFYLDLKGDVIKHYFEKLDPTVILYEEEFKNDVYSALEKLNLPKLKYVVSLDSHNSSVDEVLFKPTDDIESFEPPDIGDPNELPAVLPFTSGSTGMPKIAIQSHSMMLLGTFNRWWQMERKSVLCTLSDLRWMCEIGAMLLPVFFDVIRIYSSKREKDFDEAYEYELLHKHKVTHYVSVPILHLQLLKNAVESNNCSKLSNLKTVWLGGEVVTKSLIEYSAKIIPNCKIIGCYAMTELHGKIASDEGVSGKTVNGGVLENEFIAKIIDEDGNALGPNEKGRLCLKSKVPILGYFKNEQANKKHLRGDGWFITEEYAFMDSDHLLNVVTRYKFLLRYNGTFVNPTEIENLVNSHPNVLTSALVGYPDPEKENYSEVGTVFVILQNDSKSDEVEKELVDLLRENLTNDQAKLVRFLKVIDEVPMCNYSKINRTALKEMAAIESITYLRLY